METGGDACSTRLAGLKRSGGYSHTTTQQCTPTGSSSSSSIPDPPKPSHLRATCASKVTRVLCLLLTFTAMRDGCCCCCWARTCQASSVLQSPLFRSTTVLQLSLLAAWVMLWRSLLGLVLLLQTERQAGGSLGSCRRRGPCCCSCSGGRSNGSRCSVGACLGQQKAWMPACCCAARCCLLLLVLLLQLCCQLALLQPLSNAVSHDMGFTVGMANRIFC